MPLLRHSTLSLTLLMAVVPAGASIITTAQTGFNLQTGGTSASVSANGLSSPPYTFTGKASIDASYSGFSGNVSSYITGKCAYDRPDCPDGNLTSVVTAQISDQLFITAPSGAGFLDLRFQGGGSADFNAGGSVTINGQVFAFHGSNLSGELLIPFTNGAPIPLNLSANFGATALVSRNQSPDLGLNFQSGSLSLSYAQLLVLDQTKQYEPFLFYSSSGFNYPMASGTFTPEPASFALIALGLGVIGTLRSRRSISR